jgi:hypothetical protein
VVNVKKKVSGIVFVLLLSASLSIGLYFYNSAQDVRLVYKDNFIFHIRSAPGEEKVIKLREGLPREVSFSIDIQLNGQIEKIYPHTILDMQDGEIRLILKGNGDLQMYWSTSKIHALENSDQSFTPYFRTKKWNQIGFVYRDGILTTYMNGNPLWIKKVGRRFPLSSVRGLTLFPRLAIKDQKQGSNFIGKAKNIILLNCALPLEQVRKLYDYRNETPYSIPIKILLLFLLFNPVFYILTAFFMKISRGVRQCGFGSMKRGPYKLGLLFFSNGVFFVLFNLGSRASNYLHSTSQSDAEGNYWLILNILFLLVLFTFVLGKITDISLKRCAFLSGFILLLLATIWLLCILPRYNDIYPFIYNILFSFIYSTVPGSIDILRFRDEEFQGHKG